MNALASLDLIAYGELPSDVRLEVDRWKNICEEATKPIREWARNMAARMGVGAGTVLRKYYAWEKHGWMALVDLAKCKKWKSKWVDEKVAEANASDEFLEWFKARITENQRKTRPAWRKFAAMWARGETIPGLDNSLPRNELPPGCSYKRLIYRARDAFAQEAGRIGLSSAIGKFGPQIFTTRANLWTGSHLMIDDLWHDNFVVFNGKMVRVLELNALDVFSGCKVGWGCKPRIQKDDGSFENLKEKYARLIVAQYFWRHGFSPRGTIILAEHGTAAISERVAQILHDRTKQLYGEAKIILRESGMTGEEQAIAGRWGQGKGNFRFKAALESLHNLIHNELGDVMGQTGRDVAHRPEFLHGQLKGCEDLLKAVAVLLRDKPERAALIKLPLLEYHSQFMPLLMEVYQRINGRTWHQLEGWSEAGNKVIEYRCSPQSSEWLLPESFSALPEPIRNGVLQAAQTDDRYINQRSLSPTEVFGRDRRNLQRLPAFVIGEILGEDYAQEREVVGAYFNKFSDHEISPEPLRFESVIETPDGDRTQLSDGKYLTFVNPFDLNQMFVHDAKGACLGVAARARRVDPTDVKALHAAFGNRERRLNELLTPIRKRHTQIVKEEIAIKEAAISALQSPEERRAANAALAQERAAAAHAEAVQRVDTAQEILNRPAAEPLDREEQW